MKVIHAAYNFIRNSDPLTLTIGNFDGLHIGHQQLIERVIKYVDTKRAVLTFDPHPSSVLRDQPFRTLTQKADKLRLFADFDLDLVMFIQFNEAFSQLRIPEFIEFLKSINTTRIIMGRDSRFAYRGEGTVYHLKRYFHVIILDDILFNRTRVSSSYVKDLLMDADLNQAARLLNRPYTVHGTVIKGNSIGKQLGFPTANIDFGNYFMPKNGVYYVRLKVEGVWLKGMANIGNNPTINFSFDRRLEVYILDFKQNIYGKRIELAFHQYLRPEMKFQNRDALIQQLKKDESTIRKLTI